MKEMHALIAPNFFATYNACMRERKINKIGNFKLILIYNIHSYTGEVAGLAVGDTGALVGALVT
jgi:hypothetical protein